MFSVSSGGREIAKNTLAPHTKITIEMKKGHHAVQELEQHGADTRRLTAAVAGSRKDNQAGAISNREEAGDREEEQCSASTRPAMVDACSGNNGVPDHIARF